VTKLTVHVVRILLCESCKFGEKIFYSNWDNEFFLRDCSLSVHQSQQCSGDIYQHAYILLPAFNRLNLQILWHITEDKTTHIHTIDKHTSHPYEMSYLSVSYATNNFTATMNKSPQRAVMPSFHLTVFNDESNQQAMVYQSTVNLIWQCPVHRQVLSTTVACL